MTSPSPIGFREMAAALRDKSIVIFDHRVLFVEGWVTFVSAAAVVTHAVRLPPVMKEILWFLGLGGRGRERPG